jgi:hypothetical protein
VVQFLEATISFGSANDFRDLTGEVFGPNNIERELGIRTWTNSLISLFIPIKKTISTVDL